jgi:hypothetical protein
MFKAPSFIACTAIASLMFVSSATSNETETRQIANAALAAAALCTQVEAEKYAAGSPDSAEDIFSTALMDCRSDWLLVGPAWQQTTSFPSDPAWRIVQSLQEAIKPQIIRSIVRARNNSPNSAPAIEPRPIERTF